MKTRIFSLAALLMLLATLGSFVSIPTASAAPINPPMQVAQVQNDPGTGLTDEQTLLCSVVDALGIKNKTTGKPITFDDCAKIILGNAVPKDVNPRDPSKGTGTTTVSTCNFPVPGNLNDMPKVLIKEAELNTWFHRVYLPDLFKAPDWGGADSWFVSLALGPNTGGNWYGRGIPGEVVYRATNTSVKWCLGVLTTGKWKEQFMGAGTMPAAINVRVIPNTLIYVKTANGNVKSQATSDGGDLTIILPDNGTISIWTEFSTAAPTFESLIWWGPYDRSNYINTLDAR